MTSLELVSWVALVLAGIPVSMAAMNFALYRAPRLAPGGTRPGVSLLIPARNEEAAIGPALAAARLSRGLEALEILVLDDHSTDRTAAIVTAIAAEDPRVRLLHAPPLPEGWSGKQHACHHLGRQARYDLLVFVDSDVRLEPDALAAAADFLAARPHVALASGFPQEETASLAEDLVIPVIHFLLLGYLPMILMRLSSARGLGAGCGQFFIARRAPYEAMGGHAAIRTSLHDGVTLPRAFRRAGFMTDLFDATHLARCRMYRSAAEVWRGFSKNATEGMATWAALPVWTIILGLGHVAPLGLACAAALRGDVGALWPAVAAVALGFGLRFALAMRFRQSLRGAALHPAGIALTLAIQWSALVGAARGRRATWRGRAYPAQ